MFNIRNIYAVGRYMRYACLGMLLLLASCIKDGMDKCPEEGDRTYIRFVYDYNMSFEDLFHHQVCNIDLFLFDADESYMGRLADVAAGDAFQRGYLMELPKEHENAVKFVAFPGLQQEHLVETEMIPGVSTIDDLYVNLHGLESHTVERALDLFWHGHTASAGIVRSGTTEVSLTKNHNRFRIVFQSMDDNDLDIDEFSVELHMANSGYDTYNAMTDDKLWCYRPYYSANDIDGKAGVVELNTLRIMADEENMLVVKHLPTGKTIIDVNINRYLNALRLQEYQSMPLQEYLDREDEFKTIILLKKETIEGPGSGEDWVAGSFSINEWIPRDQEIEL